MLLNDQSRVTKNVSTLKIGLGMIMALADFFSKLILKIIFLGHLWLKKRLILQLKRSENMKWLYVFLCSSGILFSSFVWAVEPAQTVRDARGQIGKTLLYDPAYTQLNYPLGDVPLYKGVCTDVLIRALRHQGVDLQKNIHEDMQKNFKAYPQKWGLKAPDKNIDHRRVPNIATYFKRRGYEVKDQNYIAGDVVTWDLGKGLVHIGIVSDKKTLLQKTPLIIHNIGLGTQENDILHQYKITGHYRLK